MARWSRGRSRGWQNYEVWLDGEPLDYPLYADEERGLAVVAQTSAEGDPLDDDWERSQPGDPLTLVRTGRVELLHVLNYDED